MLLQWSVPPLGWRLCRARLSGSSGVCRQVSAAMVGACLKNLHSVLPFWLQGTACTLGWLSSRPRLRGSRWTCWWWVMTAPWPASTWWDAAEWLAPLSSSRQAGAPCGYLLDRLCWHCSCISRDAQALLVQHSSRQADMRDTPTERTAALHARLVRHGWLCACRPGASVWAVSL